MKLENIKHDLTLPAVKGLNVAALTAAFFLGWSLFYVGFMGSTALKWSGYILSGLFFFMYALFGKVYDAFMISTNRISELVYSQALAAIISDGMMYVVICLLMRRWMNPLGIFCVFVVQMVLAVIWCVGAHRWYFASFPARRSAVIYDIRRGMDQLIREYGMDKKFDVQLKVHAEECVKNPDMLKGMEAVFLSGVHSHERNILLKYCIINSISVYVIPRIGDILMSGTKPVHMFHLPILRADRYNPPLGYLIAKLTFDIVAAGLALIVTSPVFLLTAIAIKREDGGPVFYKQERLTKNGKKFYIHKFRSMRVDAEKDGVARLSSGDNDSRITPVGRIIRKIRVDELPQLLDILAGNLSVVGPRPEREEIALQYEKELPEFRLRLQAKAGLTGYAQVYGKYNTTPYDKLQMDLMYIANPSFMEDLRICFATVKILFMPESTEGVAEGATTAMGQEAALEEMVATKVEKE